MSRKLENWLENLKITKKLEKWLGNLKIDWKTWKLCRKLENWLENLKMVVSATVYPWLDNLLYSAG